jgi:transaldolase
MRLFIDSADLKQIERWILSGVCSGVTTNPSIIKRDAPGVDVKAHVRAIAQLCDSQHGALVSVQLGPKDEPAEWLALGDNVVVKCPMVDWGLDMAAHCGGRVNITGVCSVEQAIIGLAMRPRILSVFWGRINDDANSMAPAVVSQIARLDRGHTDLLVGSIRSPADVSAAFACGADICTVSPAILEAMTRHPATDKILGEWYGPK